MSRTRIVLLVLLVAMAIGAVFVLFQSTYRAEETGDYQAKPLQFDQDEMIDSLPGFDLQTELYLSP